MSDASLCSRCSPSRTGEVIPWDVLRDHAWRVVVVATISLDQAIATLRRTLTLPSGEPCIETRARRGVRFVARVSPETYNRSFVQVRCLSGSDRDRRRLAAAKDGHKARL